jgi:hypothetical protein
MDWFISAVMILFYWVNGNKWKYTWQMSIGICLLWIGYAISIGEYGLIISNIVIMGIALRNLFKWRKE